MQLPSVNEKRTENEALSGGIRHFCFFRNPISKNWLRLFRPLAFFPKLDYDYPHYTRMLTIRYKRIGRRHQPSYRIVVAERRSKLNGAPIEDLGSYSPFGKQVALNKERALYWLGVGAKPTDTVHNLFITSGVLIGKKLPIRMKSKKKGDAVAEASASPQIQTGNVSGAST